MLPLRCPAQNYAWGRPAASSEVAKLAGLNGSVVDDSKPYAELWMGTHPSGPALLEGSEQTLKEWIQAHPTALGDAVLARFGPDLPFLLKVLSVQTALSIQSHPDKELAERLHATQPKEYRDANHKPEMALALQGFEALCSFAPVQELTTELQAQPELRDLVGEDATHALMSAEGEQVMPALRAAFSGLMLADAEAVSSAVGRLAARLQHEAAAGRGLSAKEQLVLRLNEQYPRDVGVLAAFFLNQVQLAPGEAIYLAANEPHAYISGELVECMATSDNVIRAGLTPKFRDTEVLCSSLTYSTGAPEVLRGQAVHDHVKVYRPPFDEFEIQRIDVPAGETVELPPNPGPLLLLVHKGAGTATAVLPDDFSLSESGLHRQCELRGGSVLFVAASSRLTLTASGASALCIWAAACNGRIFAPMPALAAGAEEAAAVAVVAAAAAQEPALA